MRRLIAAIMIVALGRASSWSRAEATPGGGPRGRGASSSRQDQRDRAPARAPDALQVHSVLTAKAQAWAAHMAATGCLCHSNLTDGVSVGWRKLGENVGRGPSVAVAPRRVHRLARALRQHGRQAASSGSASASPTAAARCGSPRCS